MPTSTRVLQTPEPARLASLRGARDPLRVAGRRGDATVERGGGLEQDEGAAASRAATRKRSLSRTRLAGEQRRSLRRRRARRSRASPPPSDDGVRVAHRHHHPRDARVARPSGAQGGVRPKWAHGSSVTYRVGPSARDRRPAQGHDLGVRPAGPLVPALADDAAALRQRRSPPPGSGWSRPARAPRARARGASAATRPPPGAPLRRPRASWRRPRRRTAAGRPSSLPRPT